MKILILTDTLNVGGPGKGIFQLLDNLSELATIELGCFSYPGQKSTQFIDQARARGYALHVFTQNFWMDPRPFFQFLRLIKKNRYDIVQTHGYKTHALGLVASTLFPIRWLSVSHGLTAENFKVKLYNFLETVFVRFSHTAISVSPSFFIKIRKARGDKPCLMILNAVDANELHGNGKADEIRKKYLSPGTSLLLGCIGRMSSEKGQSVLIEAVSKVDKVSLLLIGDGPDEEKLKAKVQTLGLNSRVSFVGYQEKLRDYYEALDCLVIPSLSEGMPNVALESLSLGIPVLCSKVGALPLVIKEGENGWLVPEGEASSLVDKLHWLIQNPTALYKAKDGSQNSLSSDFTPQSRSLKFLTAYQRLLFQMTILSKQ